MFVMRARHDTMRIKKLAVNYQTHKKMLGQIHTMPETHTPSAPQPLLKVKNLCQAYHHRTILKNISFELGAAEIVTILGRNGTGKTTLLKVLANLLKPLTGTIETHQNYKGMSLFLPDGFLYEDLTLNENLKLYGNLCGANPDWRKEIAGRLGIEDFKNNQVRNLSRGQKIRGALCRSFLLDASLYLLDEPFTGLDQTSMEKLSQLLKFLRSQGKTVLLATHQIESLLGVSDRWRQMQNGQMQSLENPVRLMEEWKNL